MRNGKRIYLTLIAVDAKDYFRKKTGIFDFTERILINEVPFKFAIQLNLVCIPLFIYYNVHPFAC